MSPKEMLNIAYQEDVEIEPTANIPDIHMLDSDFEGLAPLQVVKVPLYMALSLKKSNLCRMRLPFYLKESHLEEIINFEKENMHEYAKTQPCFFELSDVLIRHAYNVENPERLKVLVQEVRELRFLKTLEGMKALDGRAFNINNLTAWEFEEVKPFILSGSEEACKLGEKRR